MDAYQTAGLIIGGAFLAEAAIFGGTVVIMELAERNHFRKTLKRYDIALKQFNNGELEQEPEFKDYWQRKV